MPVCPKCGLLISDKKYERHLRRHGTHHKHEPAELYVPSATPPWEGVERGILVGPHSRRSKGRKLWIYLFVGALLAVSLFFVLTIMFAL